MNQRIVIADDESGVREMYRDDLMDAIPDLDVDFAVDGEELVDKVKANLGYNLIMTDFQMPKMNGAEATRRIRAEGYTGPIILLSGDKLSQEELTRLGFTDYLRKPFPMKIFVNLVRSYLQIK